MKVVFVLTRRALPYLLETSAEPLKHSLHVASFLHGDDPGVVFLIHPDQEGLLIVVPEQTRFKRLNKELPRAEVLIWDLTHALIFTLIVSVPN